MLRRSRTALISAAATALLVSGCSFTAPYTTQKSYAPSDGVQVELSDEVRMENLMVLTATEGTPDFLVGVLANDSRSESVEVTLSDEKGAELWSGTVEPHSTVNLNEEPVQIDVDAAPGSTMRVDVAATGTEPVSAQAPVLDGTLPEYATYLEEQGQEVPEPEQPETQEPAESSGH